MTRTGYLSATRASCAVGPGPSRSAAARRLQERMLCRSCQRQSAHSRGEALFRGVMSSAPVPTGSSRRRSFVLCPHIWEVDLTADVPGVLVGGRLASRGRTRLRASWLGGGSRRQSVQAFSPGSDRVPRARDDCERQWPSSGALFWAGMPCGGADAHEAKDAGRLLCLRTMDFRPLGNIVPLPQSCGRLGRRDQSGPRPPSAYRGSGMRT